MKMKNKRAHTKYPPPFSLRLTDEEREELIQKQQQERQNLQTQIRLLEHAQEKNGWSYTASLPMFKKIEAQAKRSTSRSRQQKRRSDGRDDPDFDIDFEPGI